MSRETPAVDSLARLLSRAGHTGFSVSERGDVACLWRGDDEGSIVVIDAASGERTTVVRRATLERLLDADEELQPPVWSPGATDLAFGYGGVAMIGRDGASLRRVSPRTPWMAPGGRGAAAGVNRHAEVNTYLEWVSDGSAIVFVARDPDGQLAVFRSAVDGSEERRLLVTPDEIRSVALAPDGTRVAVVTTDGVTSRLRLAPCGGGEATEVDLGAQAGNAIYRYPKVLWAADDRLVVRLAGSGWSKHYLLDPGQGGTLRPLTREEFEDGAIVLSPSRDRALLSRASPSPLQERLAVVDLADGSLGELDGLRDGFLMPVAWRGDRLFYTRATVNERGDLYRCALDGTDEVRLTSSDELAASLDVVVRDVRISDSEYGVEGLPGLLYAPAGRKATPLPGVVWIHGGPVSPVSNGWATHAAWFAAHGFLVVVPAYRASAGLGTAHMHAGLRDHVGRADLDDVIAAGRWLARRDDNDAERIGVAGRSWGGYLTLRAVTAEEHPFRCGWACAGIADWEIQQAETEVRYYDLQLLGGWVTDAAVRGLARDRSPVHHLSRLAVPLLITHGREDRDVPFRQIEQFVSGARAAGAPVEHRFYDDEGHMNAEPANIADECDLALRFLRRHLVPWNLVDVPVGNQVVY